MAAYPERNRDCHGKILIYPVFWWEFCQGRFVLLNIGLNPVNLSPARKTMF